MDQQALAELAASIRAQGLMQPLLVRPVARADRYEMIAGERRWRAAQMAGLSEVPALVREVPDEAALAMALIENIQREDLNPIEEAAGLQRLVDEFRMTHEQAADAVGRSRSATTNLLRLLKLAKPVQAMLMEGSARNGPCARAARARRRAPDRGGEPHRGTRPVGARERSAGRATAARPGGAAQAHGPTATSRGSRRKSRSGWAPPCRSGPGARAAARFIVRYSSLDHLDQLLKKLR